MHTASPATRASFERLVQTVPQLVGCAPVATAIPLPERTLLHAGPPFASDHPVPAPVLNSAAAAACFEGWAQDRGAAVAAIESGDIRMAPAQDFGVVVPLAFVVSPSMWVLQVRCAVNGALQRLTPINDGPPPAALRFGAVHSDQQARLQLLSRIGPALAMALAEPIDLIPILQGGLRGGDDLHGRVTAANAALTERLAPRLSGEAAEYLQMANQFVLNAIMAACATMIGAGAGISGSTMVVAAGGNGAHFGWKLAGQPDDWQTAPAAIPVGPRFGNANGRTVLPAIGDSAVIDACGFGAAALRYAPEMMAALRGHVPEAYFTAAASDPFLDAHPAFPSDLRLGLDATRAAPLRGVMLAALDAAGEAGLVGRGIAPWPAMA